MIGISFEDVTTLVGTWLRFSESFAFLIKDDFLIGIGKDFVDVRLLQDLPEELNEFLALSGVEFVPAERQGAPGKLDLIEHGIVDRPKPLLLGLLRRLRLERRVAQHLEHLVDVRLNRVERCAGMDRKGKQNEYNDTYDELSFHDRAPDPVTAYSFFFTSPKAYLLMSPAISTGGCVSVMVPPGARGAPPPPGSMLRY